MTNASLVLSASSHDISTSLLTANKTPQSRLLSEDARAVGKFKEGDVALFQALSLFCWAPNITAIKQH